VKRSLFYQIGSRETLEFETLVEEVQFAEELGLDAIWCFPAAGGDGDFRDSAPSIWLSALASRTDRIRLGWGLAGMTPPSHPPIRIAEQAAAIDLASDGRLDVAFLPDAELVHADTGTWDEGVRMLVDAHVGRHVGRTQVLLDLGTFFGSAGRRRPETRAAAASASMARRLVGFACDSGR